MRSDSSLWKMSVCHAALSNVGLRRANNQDSFAVYMATSVEQWLHRGHLFIVADGMGAHMAGEVASKLAVETISRSYLKQHTESPQKALEQAILEAHRVLREKSRHEDAYRDMGTTCDACVMLPQGLLIGHVGDSRVYRQRNGFVEQLTFDHSLVWEVCKATNLPLDNPPSHIPKNQITRSLGPTNELKVDIEGPFPIMVGDTFLVCSDGLSGQLSDQEIGQIMALFSPEEAAETLVNLANLRGGPDNITLVIVKATENHAHSQKVDEALQTFTSNIIALGVAILMGAATIFSSFYNYFFALIAGICAVCLTIFFFITPRKSFFSPSPFNPSPPLGAGPYTRKSSESSHDFAQELLKIFGEIKQAAQKDVLSSPELSRLERDSLVAQKQSDWSSVIRNRCTAINLLMREIKQRHKKRK
ncbi:MAG: PP2C family protein-serine/threonine phosphatase [Thermoguttaceae bacterium]